MKKQADKKKKSKLTSFKKGHHPKCEWDDCQGGCHDIFYEEEVPENEFEKFLSDTFEDWEKLQIDIFERIIAERRHQDKKKGHHHKCEWDDCQGGCHDIFYEG